MLHDLRPLRFLLVLFAGFVNREQAKVIDYLREENRVLRQQLGKRRLRFTDEQRARLAAKAKALGRSVLDAVATLVTPETLLRWHRMLVAKKWTHPGASRPGRPPVMRTIRELTLRMAKDNPGWGYTRIVGALANVGHTVARTTVAKILKAAGIAPAPLRPTSWRTFLKAHADTIAAADFFSVEVWTARGLVTHYVLFAIDLATRAVHIAGVTPNPDGAFMAQVARNLTDSVDGFLRGKKKLIVDRDTKFTEAFRKTLAAAGVDTVLTAVRAPNMNAIAERFVKTIQDECLSRMVLFGEGMLRRAIAEFVEHYHTERNHQGARQSAAATGADAAGNRGDCASECPARWAAELLPTAQATSGELSPARQSGEGDRGSFRCGCLATGAPWARLGRLKRHSKPTSNSASVPGNARVRVLGHHGHRASARATRWAAEFLPAA